MLNKSIAFVSALVALFLMVGLQARSQAQSASAFSSSWAGTTGSPSILKIYTDPSYDDSGNLGGRFGVSGTNFACQGAVFSLVTSKDAQGNYKATLTGGVMYYPIINGTIQTHAAKRGTATMVLSLLPNGTSSEGVTILDTSGHVLFSTGTAADGTIAMWSLSKGSIKISL